jgi:hypothetical protein
MSATHQANTTEQPPAAVAAPPTGDGPARTFGPLLADIAVGWLICAVTTALHLDWILLPLLVVAVASVLRAGASVVDRLMLSTFLVAGTVVVGGIVFSLWPWGLAPFPVAGLLFTALALVAWLGNRRPRFPRRLLTSDLIILGTALFVAVAEFRPLLRIPYADRLPSTATSEDRATHFSIFDTIHRLGSYPFLDQARARVPVGSPTEAAYPAGSHLIYAVIDTFTRSTTDPGPAVDSFNRYFVLVLAGYAFFVMSTVWAARWILSPLVRGWRLFAATSTVAAVMVGGPFMVLVSSGYDAQILGIAFTGLTVAVAIRPPASIADRIALLGTGIILVAYTYYLYLPLVAIAVAASMLVTRRSYRGVWHLVLASAGIVAAISILPLYFAANSPLDVGAQVLAHGAPSRTPRSAAIAATIASLAVALVPAYLRYRRIRTILVTVPALAGVILLVGAYQTISLGTTIYYFDKLLACYLVVAIICGATLVLFLHPLTAGDGEARRGRLREAGLGLAAAVLAFTGVAGLGVGSKFSNPATGTWGETSLGLWFTGKQMNDPAVRAELRHLAGQGLLADGTTTLLFLSDDSYVNWQATVVNATLNRNGGAAAGSISTVLRMSDDALPGDGKPLSDQAIDKAVDALDKAASLSREPLRIVVRNQKTAAAIERVIATKSGRRVTVVVIPIA